MCIVMRKPLFDGMVLVLLLLSCPLARAADASFSEAQVPLIFPGMSMQGTETARYEVPEGGQRLELRSAAGERIEALFCPALEDPAAAPTVIWFYGNAQCIAHALQQVDLLRRCGANVLIADYLGYGLSEGRPSEAGCYQTALALYEHAMSREDIDRGKLVAGGWSLGAAVAIDLASRKQMVGLMTFSAYTSKRELAKRQFPGVPSEAIEHPFLSEDKIRTVTCPTLIVHGRRDTLVPFAMSEALRQVARGTVTYLPIDRAGHNDLFSLGAELIETSLREFLKQVTSTPASRPTR